MLLVPILFMSLSMGNSRLQAQPVGEMERRSLAALYKKPQEILQPDQISRLEGYLQQTEPDFRTIRDNARVQLDRYNAQFIADKRIADQRRFSSYDPGRSDANSLRLLAVLRDRKTGSAYFLGDAPYLRRLYSILGQAYVGLNDNARALWAYGMALRYASRDIIKVGVADVLPSHGEDQNDSAALRAAHDTFLLMQISFAQPDRIAQESDPGIAAAARRFRETFPLYQENRVRARDLQKQIYTTEASLARGQTPKPALSELRIRLKNEITARERRFQMLEEIRQGAYEQFRRRKAQREGQLAYRMALLVRSLEEENHYTGRKLHQNSYLRGTGAAPLPDRTRQRNFAGYATFLELAHFFDPENLEYLNLLGEEYRLSQRPLRSISFTEKYIEQARLLIPVPAELGDAYLRLARLQTDRRDYLAAALAREEHYKLKTPDQRSVAMIQTLANLHFNHTGRLARAAVLYDLVIKNFDSLDLAQFNLEDRISRQSNIFRIFQRRAKIEKRARMDNAEKELLLRARVVYQSMNSEKQTLFLQERKLQSDLLEIKKELLVRERPELQQQYYQLIRKQLPAAQAARLLVERRMRAMNYGGLLDRLARIAFKERRFAASREYFLELVSRGRGDQATAARRNLLTIEQILADGIMRPLPASAIR